MIFVKDAVENGLSEELLVRLETAELIAGFEFEITSGFRDGDDGYHGVGQAVDLRCSELGRRFRMVKALILVGFERIGVYNLHVHVDLGEKMVNVLWLGVSK